MLGMGRGLRMLNAYNILRILPGMVMATFKREDVRDVPDQAFQPTHISIPRREFGKSAPVR